LKHELQNTKWEEVSAGINPHEELTAFAVAMRFGVAEVWACDSVGRPLFKLSQHDEYTFKGNSERTCRVYSVRTENGYVLLVEPTGWSMPSGDCVLNFRVDSINLPQTDGSGS
jgi:hypothetical protein